MTPRLIALDMPYAHPSRLARLVPVNRLARMSLASRTTLGYASVMSNADPRARMAALVKSQPLGRLCDALLMLDAKGNPDEAERLTQAVITDEICERCPAADAAFNAWAGSDDFSAHSAARAIVAAAMAA